MELANIKVQEKINMNKQINRFENVLGEMKGIVMRNDEDDDKYHDITEDKEDDDEEDDEDQFAAKCYDLGFLKSKLIKNVVCCLTENQQLGIIPLFAVIKIKSAPGLFFSISVFLELSLLSSDVGMYILLYSTDYLYFATFLFLLKVSRRLDLTFLTLIFIIIAVSGRGCSNLSHLASKQRHHSSQDSYTWCQTVALQHRRHHFRTTPQDHLLTRLRFLLESKETFYRGHFSIEDF